MILTLVGPDDSGFWYLEDAAGNDWRVVERWSDHPGAAALFGWIAPNGASDDEQVVSARDFLMERIGDSIQAPLHIAEHFEQFQTPPDAQHS
jgi:hypothetical protein